MKEAHFVIEPHDHADKQFAITGPEITLYVDYDDVDHDKVDSWAEWVVLTLNQAPLARANRFALRCPHCDKEGANSPSAGGNEKCFHCGECGFVECEWSSPAHEIVGDLYDCTEPINERKAPE